MILNKTLSVVLAVSVLMAGCQTRPSSPTGNPADVPQLTYTKHARCRMDCRHINEREVKEVIMENQINERKSNANGKPCPAYAYEGTTTDHQHLRIIIGKCDNNWKVITCIDLDNEFQCNCD